MTEAEIMESTLQSSIDINSDLDFDLDFNDNLNEPNELKNTITESKIELAMKAIESRNVAKNLGNRVTKKSNSATHRSVPKKIDEICFNTERFLLGHLLNAIDSSKNKDEFILLTCWGDKNILINPEQSEIITDLTDNQIRSLAIASIDDELSSPIKIELFDSAGSFNKRCFSNKEKIRTFSLEIFMWNLGLMTSRGRIPIEVSTSDCLSLRRWPNLTRMNIPDNAMRIISYWSKNTCSIMDIHTQLNIPLHDIFTVYTAASSAELITLGSEKSDKQFTKTGDKNDKRGLFSSIINRLRQVTNDKNTISV